MKILQYLWAAFISDLELVHNFSNIISNMKDLTLDPSPTQESVIGGPLIDIYPESKINSKLPDGPLYSLGSSRRYKSGKRLNFDFQN